MSCKHCVILWRKSVGKGKKLFSPVQLHFGRLPFLLCMCSWHERWVVFDMPFHFNINDAEWDLYTPRFFFFIFVRASSLLLFPSRLAGYDTNKDANPYETMHLSVFLRNSYISRIRPLLRTKLFFFLLFVGIFLRVVQMVAQVFYYITFKLTSKQWGKSLFTAKIVKGNYAGL